VAARPPLAVRCLAPLSQAASLYRSCATTFVAKVDAAEYDAQAAVTLPQTLY